MKTLNHILLTSTTGIILLAASACSSSRKSVSSESVATDRSATELRYAALDSSIREWTDVNVPFSFSLSSPTDFSISGRMKMIHGRSVDISLRLLGIEMARIMVTRDSVFATYRLKKLYAAQPIPASESDIAPLMANLQDMFMGRPFIPGRPASSSLPSLQSFAVTDMRPSLRLSPLSPGVPVACSFIIGPDNRLTAAEFATPDAHNAAAVAYSAYTPTTAGDLPRRDDITVSLSSLPLPLKASIDWKWGSAKWDTGISITWTPPQGYREVSLAEFFSTVIK